MLERIGWEIQSLIETFQYEYVDFLLTGIEPKIMKIAGFVPVEKEDTNIIPTYFEPFKLKRIEMWYTKSTADMVLFKGESDGDRPSERPL